MADVPKTLPSTLLRCDLLESGDVILTHGGEWDSKAIARLSGGEFSHAALVVNEGMVFESDGGVIGHKSIQWLGWGIVDVAQTKLGRLWTDPGRIGVFRHPELRKLPPGTFEAAL
jgi:hypothetical protein